MARVARIVAPNFPHHVTQRGNRKQKTFFNESDYQAYFDLLVEAKLKADVEIWAYCLMPNHVHFIIVPSDEDGLAKFFSQAHRKYTRRVNAREGWQGHLWQERFHSFVMDDNYLLAAVRYTEFNPVRAGLCNKPNNWHWSSANAHLSGSDNHLVNVEPMLARVGDWDQFLNCHESESALKAIRSHARTGWPIGDDSFIQKLETQLKRKVSPGPRGPKAVK